METMSTPKESMQYTSLSDCKIAAVEILQTQSLEKPLMETSSYEVSLPPSPSSSPSVLSSKMTMDTVLQTQERRTVSFPSITHLILWVRIGTWPPGQQKDIFEFAPFKRPSTLRESGCWGTSHHEGAPAPPFYFVHSASPCFPTAHQALDCFCVNK